ncbi:carbonic anhydrase [Shimia sp.]|uniref:carbonic anhydrase n=1 Tax=Shimia sp. TaxID=1954381 RepID=UPI003569A436
MQHAKPLPSYLVKRFLGWKATNYTQNQSWYRHLVAEGQHPRAMVISCCDSRVHVTSIFGADQGEFFIHRNIANLVPTYNPDGDFHGTSAAVEYAVTALKVAHLIVMGHSQCGGVQGCIDMCEGKAPQLEAKDSFVGRWMDMLKPRYETVAKIKDPETKARAFERQAVVVSLENLMTFPFVRERVEAGDLSLHGLWHNIGEGGLEGYDAKSGKFENI